MDIGFVTDEISRDLEEALTTAMEWGVSRFELREGGQHRFPDFSLAEVEVVESALSNGAQVTAVSPGLLKLNPLETGKLNVEIDQQLPKAIELGLRFQSKVMILFGFEMAENEPPENRTLALRFLERAARQVSDAGMTVAIENEPNFWFDTPAGCISLLTELDHPDVRLNWDPCNLHWGGTPPTVDHFEIVRPLLANMHIKDYYPENPEAPWVAVGDGSTPWADLLPRVIASGALPHVTIETHSLPRMEQSRRSLDWLSGFLENGGEQV